MLSTLRAACLGGAPQTNGKWQRQDGSVFAGARWSVWYSLSLLPLYHIVYTTTLQYHTFRLYQKCTVGIRRRKGLRLGCVKIKNVTPNPCSLITLRRGQVWNMGMKRWSLCRRLFSQMKILGHFIHSLNFGGSTFFLLQNNKVLFQHPDFLFKYLFFVGYFVSKLCPLIITWSKVVLFRKALMNKLWKINR